MAPPNVIPAPDPNHVLSNWVHTDGVVSLAYSPDGQFLYSGGADSLIRRFDPANPNEDPEVISQNEEAVTALDASFDHLASACETGEVALFTHAPNFKSPTAFLTFATRTTLVPRCVRFDGQGKRVAVASDELIVKLVDVRDPLRVQLLTGHTKSVRALSWSPDGLLLATSGSEGAIRIWEVGGGDQNSTPVCTQVLDGIIAAAEPESLYSVECCWHPSGNYFVVPSRTHDIAVVAKTPEGWKSVASFGNLSTRPEGGHGHASDISSLAFSPNGNYLASGGKDELIYVWDSETRQAVAKYRLDTAGLPTAIRWQPEANNLAVGDAAGYLTRWDNVIDLAVPGRTHPSNAPRKEAAKSKEPRHRESSLIVGGDADDQDEDNYDLGDDDWIIDGDDGVFGRSAPSRPARPQPDSRHQRAHSTVAAVASSAVQRGQPSFQPGSTSLRDKRRYLAFNMIGTIHIVEKDEMENLVTVDFHDVGARRGYNFVDPFKFELASLGELGILFASKGNAQSQAVVRYEAYETWASSAAGDSDRSWQYELPLGEDPVCVGFGGVVDPAAAQENRQGLSGSGTAVVATTAGYIRFFTGSGLQKYVWNLGAGVVSLACGRDWALVVVRGAGDATLAGQQNLRYLLVDTDSFEIIQEGPLPLGCAKGTTLKWCGFSEDGRLPCIYDSEGRMSVLEKARRPRQARWVPVLETKRLKKEGRTEDYWMVGATATEMLCIILKGGEKQPHFPTPLIQNLTLEMPLLKMDDAQTQLEEKFLLGNLMLGHQRDGADPDDYTAKTELARAELELDKHLLKLIQTACKADKLSQALDAAQMLSQPQSVDAAVKIAAFFRLQGLQERIEMVKETRTQGFVSSRWQREDAKRKSKYSHFEDHRTIADSVVPSAHRSHEADHAKGALSKPFEAVSRNVSGALSNGNVFSKPVAAQVGRTSGPSSEPDLVMDEDDEHEVQDEDGSSIVGGQTPAPKRPRLSDHHLSDPSNPRPTTNPFAKKAAPAEDATSSPNGATNPFASGRAGPASRADLRKSGSFFDRVDGHEKPAGAKQKQSTLFGMAPPPKTDDATKKGGKKRKGVTADENTGSQPPKPKAGGLASFLKPRNGSSTALEPAKAIKKPTKEVTEETGDIEMDDAETPMEATQLESQVEGEESQASLAPIDFDETQAPPRIRTTQPDDIGLETPELGSPPPAAKNDGISKLAAFRASAAAAA